MCEVTSKVIDRQKDDETNERLKVWCTKLMSAYAEYAIKGAKAGQQYGLKIKVI